MVSTTQLLQHGLSPNATIQFRLCDDATAVEIDSTQLQQIVMNLVLNASESLGASTGVVTMSTAVHTLNPGMIPGTETLEAGKYVLMTISDTGCGMSSDTMERIFDPLFTTKLTGRGLGLAAARSIVNDHRGALLVSSALEVGTEFSLLLPLAPPGESAAAVGPALSRVLVIAADDEERAITRRFLQVLKFDPIEVSCLEAALEAIAAGTAFQVILLDADLPDCDLEFSLMAVREAAPTVPMTLTTEADFEFSREVNARPNGLLRKPFTPAALANLLKTALAGTNPTSGKSV